MGHFVCPWWGGYFIDNGLRRLIHPPGRILAPYVKPGMTTIDFGCGMGQFAIAMARLVGDGGQVIAVDLQPQMLDVLGRRAAKAGVSDRIRTHRCEADALHLDAQADFALAFYSAHEVPDQRRLLAELHAVLRPDASLLVVEPVGHVPADDFQATEDLARQAGFLPQHRPHVRLSRAVLFARA